MDYRTQLLALAAAHSAATGMSEARIATLAINHGAFFSRMRDGKACSVDTYLKVKRWFADHWPVDAVWPEGADRPDVLPVTPTPSRRRKAAPSHEARA